jgi:hypothetical protein
MVSSQPSAAYTGWLIFSAAGKLNIAIAYLLGEVI